MLTTFRLSDHARGLSVGPRRVLGSTGVDYLDRIWAPLADGNVVLITGPPRGGRSMLAVHLSVALAKAGMPVRFYLGQDPVDEVVARVRSNATGERLRDCRLASLDPESAWSSWAWDFVVAPPFIPEVQDSAFLPGGGSCVVVVDDLDLWQSDPIEIAERARRWVRGPDDRLAILTAPAHLVQHCPAADRQRWIRAADIVLEVRETGAGDTLINVLSNRRGPRGEFPVHADYERARVCDPPDPQRPVQPPSGPVRGHAGAMTGHDWDSPDPDALLRSRKAALEILKVSGSGDSLSAFYDPGGPYAGATFHDLAPLDSGRVTASDLLAITLMNVAVQPPAVRRLLEDDANRTDLADALRRVPPGVSLADAAPDVLDAAAELYDLIKALLRGNKWVTASKIAARKRPLLIPVRDRVIVEKLQLDNKHFRHDWTIIRALLRDDEVATALAKARAAAAKRIPVVATVPQLRLLDTVVWMHGRTLSDDQAAEDVEE